MTTTNEQLKAFLNTIEIDNEVITLLEAERITSIRKLENLNDEAYSELKAKLDSVASRSDLHYINRFTIAVNYAKVKGLAVPTYNVATSDEIESFINTTEKMINEADQNDSTSKESNTTPAATSNKPKRSLTSFSDCKMPKIPVTVKKMHQFKISFINILRSMKLEYLLEDSFVEPLETDASYSSFQDDNSFLYSALIAVTEGHEALRWINKEALRNNGVSSWKTIIKWYDAESIEESLSASTLKKIIDLKLKEVHLGACSSFITTFASYLDIFEEEKVPLPSRLARDLFLLNIEHEKYNSLKNELRLRKKTLNECYEEVKSLSLNVESGQRKTNRQIRIQKQKEREQNGELLFKGKKVNEFGFFIDKEFFKGLSAADKQSYYKMKDDWKKRGLIQEYVKQDRGTGKSATIRNMKSELDSLADTLSPPPAIAQSDEDDLKSVMSELTSADRDNMSKALRLFTSHLKVTRTVHMLESDSERLATIDNGADTYMLGSAFKVFEWTDRSANVHSFDASLHLKNMRIGSGITAFDLPDGEGTILLVVHEGIVNTSQPNSIFSVTQSRHHGVDICDRHGKFQVDGVPGRYSMKLSGYELPFEMVNGLTSLRIRLPNEDELRKCPIVELTSDAPWDPQLVSGDNFIPSAAPLLIQREPSDDIAYNILNTRRNRGDFSSPLYDPVYPTLDSYVFHRVSPSITKDCPSFDNIETVYELEATIETLSKQQRLSRQDDPPNWAHTQRCMGWFPLDVIKKTWDATTQLAKVTSLPYRHHKKSRYPQLNRPRLHESYATDTWFASEPAITGETCVQMFVGLVSQLVFAYGMKTESEGPSKLRTFVREIGAPFSLINDNSKMQTGTAWTSICNEFNIGTGTTEPHHPWQNPAERKIGTVKNAVNRLMDRTNTPSKLWFQCTIYVCLLLNVLANPQLNWRTPMERGMGITPDISPFIQFQWYEPVLFLDDDASFPSTRERKGYWCGPTENVGDSMTYWILTDDTQQLIARSNVRSALAPATATGESNVPLNFRAFFPDNLEGSVSSNQHVPYESPDDESSVDSASLEPDKTDQKEGVLSSLNDLLAKISGKPSSSIIDPSHLLGYSFVTENDDVKQRATVTDVNPELDQVSLTFMNGSKQLLQYNDFINLLNAHDEDGDGLQAYKGIIDHRKHKGKWEVFVEWEDGDKTWEPLSDMRLHDMITLAAYAHDNDLVTTQGWKWAKNKTKNPKKFLRMAKIFKSQVHPPGPRYKYGVRVPRNSKEAYHLDKVNGNTLWEDALNLEIEQLFQYDTFNILAKGEKAPTDHQKIPGFFVFDVKHDLRRKARFVAGGHVTNPPKEEVYSGVVGHESVHIAMFLAEHNGLDILATDVGNAYLHGVTREKVYIVAGPEFGEHEGKVMIIVKALYGLVSSAARWHEALSKTLRSLGYSPSKADSDMWLKDCDTHYEYILAYSDDLLIISKNPKAIVVELKKKYILKGSSFPEFYLGGDYNKTKGSDGTNVSYFSAKTYVKNVCDKIENTFDIKLRPSNVPFDPDYHPEIDETPLLTANRVSQYRMLTGSALWATVLGRHDIQYATCTLARYNSLPREGHLQAALKLFGYLKNNPKACTIFDTREPDLSMYNPVNHNWQELYPGAREELPPDMPTPKMKPITILAYFDASHAPCLLTRRSVTGIILQLNRTVIRCISKRQNTVETSTYGAEMVAARLCVEQVMDMRYKLRMLGVPVTDASVMLGDNQSTITSCTIPSSSLKKKHNAIAYHRVREAVAAGIVQLFHVRSEDNLADTMTKPLNGKKLRGLWKPYLFGSPQG